VHRAYDGTSAVETALRVLPQIVFLDVGLPGLDGFEVARRLRSLAALRGLRIVAVTGRASKADRERACECGVDRYYVKPVPPRFLESVVEEAGAGAFAELLGILERGQQSGAFKKQPVRGQAAATWALVHGFTLLAIDGQLLPEKVGAKPIDAVLASMLEGLES